MKLTKTTTGLSTEENYYFKMKRLFRISWKYFPFFPEADPRIFDPHFERIFNISNELQIDELNERINRELMYSCKQDYANHIRQAIAETHAPV